MMALGKLLVVAGLALLVLGAMILLAPRLGLPAPGKLPVDFAYKSPRFTLYVPFATCVAISAILTALFYFVGRR